MTEGVKISLPAEALVELYQYVPYFHACVRGPNTPLGPTHLPVDYIVAPSYEAAEMYIWGYIEGVCLQADFPFDPSEWSIEHIHLLNGGGEYKLQR